MILRQFWPWVKLRWWFLQKDLVYAELHDEDGGEDEEEGCAQDIIEDHEDKAKDAEARNGQTE